MLILEMAASTSEAGRRAEKWSKRGCLTTFPTRITFQKKTWLLEIWNNDRYNVFTE
jgi:hypothetical protein